MRLFVPYKRRKRDGSSGEDQLRKKLSVTKQLKAGDATSANSKSDETTGICCIIVRLLHKFHVYSFTQLNFVNNVDTSLSFNLIGYI